MDIRLMTIADLPQVQHCNLINLPENYFVKYYLYHVVSWPLLSYVAVDVSRPARNAHDPPRVVGYVLARMDDDAPKASPVGQITSLSVSRTHRRLGLAERLMRQSQRAMAEVYGATTTCLHVRQSNKPAFNLYTNKLGFNIKGPDLKYYIDKEDAFIMEADISRFCLTVRDGVVVPSAAERRALEDARRERGEPEPDEEAGEAGDEGEPVGSLDSAANANGGLVEIVEKMDQTTV